jgi:hypothetical protein
MNNDETTTVDAADENAISVGELAEPAAAESVSDAEKEDTTEEEQSTIDIEAIERAAEERGYLRGRNERIEELMGAPAMWEPLHKGVPMTPEEPIPTILQDLRPGVWD